jgi:hypothetical protein
VLKKSIGIALLLSVAPSIVSTSFASDKNSADTVSDCKPKMQGVQISPEAVQMALDSLKKQKAIVAQSKKRLAELYDQLGTEQTYRAATATVSVLSGLIHVVAHNAQFKSISPSAAVIHTLAAAVANVATYELTKKDVDQLHQAIPELKKELDQDLAILAKKEDEAHAMTLLTKCEGISDNGAPKAKRENSVQGSAHEEASSGQAAAK